jgi:dUTP pyrophosphatase
MIKYFLDKPHCPSLDLRLERQSAGASGYDLMANLSVAREMQPGERWFVSTGLYLEMPSGVEGQIRSRSGLAKNHGVIVLNAPGTIDSDFRGEVCVTLLNTDRSQPHTIHPGNRVAQLVFAPVVGADVYQLAVQRSWEPVRVGSRGELSLTARGASGHGSTGQ